MGPPMPPLRLQRNLPHCRPVCLAELQCQYLPRRSHHTLALRVSPGYHSAVKVPGQLNFRGDLSQSRVSPLQALPEQFKFSPMAAAVCVHVRVAGV